MAIGSTSGPSSRLLRHVMRHGSLTTLFTDASRERVVPAQLALGELAPPAATVPPATLSGVPSTPVAGESVGAAWSVRPAQPADNAPQGSVVRSLPRPTESSTPRPVAGAVSEVEAPVELEDRIVAAEQPPAAESSDGEAMPDTIWQRLQTIFRRHQEAEAAGASIHEPPGASEPSPAASADAAPDRPEATTPPTADQPLVDRSQTAVDATSSIPQPSSAPLQVARQTPEPPPLPPQMETARFDAAFEDEAETDAVVAPPSPALADQQHWAVERVQQPAPAEHVPRSADLRTPTDTVRRQESNRTAPPAPTSALSQASDGPDRPPPQASVVADQDVGHTVPLASAPGPAPVPVPASGLASAGPQSAAPLPQASAVDDQGAGSIAPIAPAPAPGLASGRPQFAAPQPRASAVDDQDASSIAPIAPAPASGLASGGPGAVRGASAAPPPQASAIVGRDVSRTAPIAPAPAPGPASGGPGAVRGASAAPPPQVSDIAGRDVSRTAPIAPAPAPGIASGGPRTVRGASAGPSSATLHRDVTDQEHQATAKILAHVAAGGPTRSTIETIVPRRPRPSTPARIQRMTAPQPPMLRPPAGSEERTSAAEADRGSPTPEMQTAAPQIATPIGPLPADLWELIGEPVPPADDVTSPLSPIPSAASVPPHIQRARPTGFGRTTGAPAIARQPGLTARGPDVTESSVAQAEDEGAGGEDGPPAVDTAELARRVYSEIKRRLSVEQERFRGL